MAAAILAIAWAGICMNTHRDLCSPSHLRQECAMSVRDDAPPTSNEPGPPITTGLKRVVVASMAGTVVEWYEFFLYGTAATIVFNKVFFSETTSELNAIFLAFATYAVGFIARPVGGVVFGHFGDKYGRKKLLQFSLLLVGAAT